MKSHKILFAIIFIIIIAVFLTGCNETVDIDDKLIITAIAFDYKDGEILCYFEAANIESGNSPSEEGSGGSKYIMVKSRGETLVALREYSDTQLELPLYLSGIRTIILTEEFADQHLIEFLYRFRMDENYRKKVLMVITKEDPEKLYEEAHKKNYSVGFIVEGIIKNLYESGKSIKRTTMRLLENLSSEYSGIILPCIGFRDKEVSLVGQSVVKGQKVTGFIPMQDATGAIYLKAERPKFFFIVPYNDIDLSIEVLLGKRKITPSYKDGKISFNIKMEYKCELLYGNKKTPYNFEDEANKKVSESLKVMLTQLIADAIEQAQNEFECDYLQFDDIFRIKYPVVFQKMDWYKEFSLATIEIESKIELVTKWNMDYGANKIS